MSKRKRKTKTQIKKEADRVFSLYIRKKYSDWRGNVRCYTCDKVGNYASMQNGHFVSRSSSTLRFSEDNCRVQCVACNVFKNGNYIEYTLRLIQEKGKAFVEKLRKRGKETHQFTEQELQEIIDTYNKKLKEL